jgi:predicted transcriptional regulator
LGARAWQVWRFLLLEGPQQTRGDIVKKTGIPVGSVYRAVSNLIGARLVTYDMEDGVIYADSKTDAGLQELARELGVDGKAERKAEFHRTERERRINNKIRRAREKWTRKRMVTNE